MNGPRVDCSEALEGYEIEEREEGGRKEGGTSSISPSKKAMDPSPTLPCLPRLQQAAGKGRKEGKEGSVGGECCLPLKGDRCMHRGKVEGGGTINETF